MLVCAGMSFLSTKNLLFQDLGKAIHETTLGGEGVTSLREGTKPIQCPPNEGLTATLFLVSKVFRDYLSSVVAVNHFSLVADTGNHELNEVIFQMFRLWSK